jgi:carboxyl-terminal processing protease
MKRKLLSILFILTVLTLAYVPAGQAANPSSGYAEYLQAVMDMAQSNYNFEVSDQELLEGAMKGIFSSMDDYTEYFTREEAKGFMQTVGGKYEGIGVVLAEIEGYATITRVFPSSPAEKAGLLPGDKIAVVDKTEVFKKSIDQVTSLIKGEAGTPVTLKIIRDGSQNLLTINVIRAQIKINPVSYEIRNGIGYISIDTFNSYAAPSLRSSWKLWIIIISNRWCWI